MVQPFSIWLVNVSYAGLSVGQLKGQKPQQEHEKSELRALNCRMTFQNMGWGEGCLGQGKKGNFPLRFDSFSLCYLFSSKISKLPASLLGDLLYVCTFLAAGRQM